ncbi:nuclear GTPase SLIP-GC-like isoform X2 [Cyclopterus lumpus]|uniref:Dynamin N-terminal domain-containing protein n=2 Tax=Cyclopterus lumpus TaxID=8103 RepID=A0A8C3G118_CYCLU|nr:nuclear GTPase SLIP-GC-like isoform X2 [Cyclopterus lumpus]
MDDFVRDKLTEWDLSELIETFKAQGIDRESFYFLDHQDIAVLIPTVGPRSKFKKRLKSLKKEQKPGNPEVVDSSAQVCPSTSGKSNKGKRRSDLQGESSQWRSPTRKPRLDTKPASFQEEILLSDVKNIMSVVHQKIPQQDNKLNNFLRRKIDDLETDKREVVGVFGKTGAGKSYLINTVIGESNLLPSGSISACTSVMIKVEANMQNLKYEADIEFITKEEWKDELWFSKNFLRDSADHKMNEDEEKDRKDIVEKLSVLYGEDWDKKSPEDLMDDKYFKEIPEFLNSDRKMLTGKTTEALSAKLVLYTKNGSKVKRWYWPLVKCVTIRVPNNDLLKHVTLVDLPGNGDRNKSRDKMWKAVVGSCSTVWIVTDINRAATEPEAWEILKSACRFMGNAGQCRQIHFICTKSDESSKSPDRPSPTDIRDFILERNVDAKKEVIEEFSKLNKVKKHFSDGSLKVFTVSSFEFLSKTVLEPKETEIPELQEFLKGLNDCHSVTLNYVKGALGILSQIQGARLRDGADIKTAVCTDFGQKMKDALDKVRKSMEETHQAFEECLSEGVEKSKSSCGKNLKSVIHPNIPGNEFHRTLKSIVQHDGTYKTRKGKQINLNMKLSSCLTESIDEKFKKTFPNEGECGQFNGVLNLFSLDTEMMTKEKKYKDVKLQLIFLSTEEDKIKTKLNKIIRNRKKMIYSSLTTTIETTMQECYDVAKQKKGPGSLKDMRDTINDYVLGSKDVMFQTAKDDMLNQLRALMREILEVLEKTMQESIDLSLKTDGVSIPDVEIELEMVKNHYKELMGSPDEEPLI